MSVVTNLELALSSLNTTISVVESYHSPPCSLFPIHPDSGLSGDWGLEQYHNQDWLSPSSIYPLHLASCQTVLCHWPSLQTPAIFCFSIFIHLGTCLCLLFLLFLLSFLSVVFYLYLCFSFHPSPLSEKTAASVRCLKIEAAEKQKVMDTSRYSSGNLRGTADGWRITKERSSHEGQL